MAQSGVILRVIVAVSVVLGCSGNVGDSNLDGSEGESESEGEGDSDCGSAGAGGDSGAMQDIAVDPGHYYAFVPEAYDPATPMPMLLNLHGDEGDPTQSVIPLWQSTWQTGADFIMIVPQAPYPEGDHSWYQDYEGNAAWLDEMLADVFGRWNVDLERVWVTSLSGGSVFVGLAMFERQDVFAAVAFNLGGGGGNSYVAPPDEACKIPARFTVGTDDFLYEQAQELYNTLLDHDHETEWVDLPGCGHKFCEPDEQIVANLAWLRQHELCGTDVNLYCD
jgi:predicted esterase